MHASSRAIFSLVLALLADASAANTFDVAPDVSGGPGNYTWSISIDNASATGNPTLTMLTGQTYSFNVNPLPIHSFWIDQADGIFGGAPGTNPYPVGTGELSDNDVTTVETVTMTLPANAPDVLYYACGNHPEMKGMITVVHDLVFRNSFE
jgi:hypothetical protein